ncbi:MAG: TIM barrel protein [Planctomycetaceae bacterium]|nr:TIM barrel protein [Planctomycetaceae bacterium]
MDRRSFLTTGLAAGAALTAGNTVHAAETKPKKFGGFNLKYAPHFGMFKNLAGNDLIDQLKFMRDEGFVALEDNNMMGRDVETQNSIAGEMQRLGIEMGVFVAYKDFQNPTLASGNQDELDKALEEMKKAVECAKRVNAKWCTVVPGTIAHNLEPDYQTRNVVEALKRMAAVCEPSGLTMVLESLNRWTNHPDLFLWKIPQAYMICQAVGSPSCKILDDLYHQQISEGNLIPNMEMAWEEIPYIQVGDNPGRKEPTTGEINYRNIFKWLYNKGYEGIVGMEHGNSQPGPEGEKAVIAAYREVDDFETT